MPKSVLYVGIILLIIGILPMPYGYYTFLRIILTAIFAWVSIITFDREFNWITGISICLAILFNPVIKIYLPKEIWIILDVISAIFLFLVRKKLQLNEINGET